VTFFLCDFVRAVLRQPRGDFRFAQAGRRRVQLLEHGGRFLQRGVVDGVENFLVRGNFWIGHKQIVATILPQNTTDEIRWPALARYFFEKNFAG
jgi:hypothetical protein